MKMVDMRGQPCPIPVVNAKKALAEQGTTGVSVLVDTLVAVQNLEKMARGTGCGFSYTGGAETGYTVTIVKGEGAKGFDAPDSAADTAVSGVGSAGPVVLITSDTMGRGANDLGRLLIKGFIFSLSQLTVPPEAVIFLNAGARLTTEGANTVPDLKALEEKGAAVCTCGTCANYYKLTDSLAVGRIVDMGAITNRLAQASLVITI
jgi:selenium metabolism protein YedF